MTSACWCRVRGLSWKLPKSILESPLFSRIALSTFVIVSFSSFPLTCRANWLHLIWSPILKNTVVPQHLLFSLGFKNVVSIDMLRESFPLLDMVDHNRRPKLPVSHLRTPLTSATATEGVFVEDLMLISSSFPVQSCWQASKGWR